jgi:hypothetical protein
MHGKTTLKKKKEMNSNSAWCMCLRAVDLPQQCNMYNTAKGVVGSENE